MTTGEQALYDSFIADYYDNFLGVVDRQDAQFYLAEARASGGPVLELGCGTGRILLELARAGLRVTGLDLSARMLAKCRAKLDAEPPDVRARAELVHDDMTAFNLAEQFRTVIIPFRPFQHLLEVEQQLACLRAVARHLAPGGKLILDFFQTDARRMHDPEFFKERPAGPETVAADGRRLRVSERTVAFHRAEQRNDVEMYYNVTHPDGRTERHVFAFTIRYFFRYEVEHLLARCGFRVVALYGDAARSPLRDDSPDMIFVTEKPMG
jgi:SAM-dependent methyltransferase